MMSSKWREDFIRKLGGKGKSKATLRKILRGKDLIPMVDNKYLGKLKGRLVLTAQYFSEMSPSLNGLDEQVGQDWDECVRLGKILLFKNQGRRREDVFYVWMQGKTVEKIVERVLKPLLPARHLIIRTGGDNLEGTGFERLATADLKIERDGKGLVRLEIQAGMDGESRDVKLLKIEEAIRRKDEFGEKTFLAFLDLNSGELFAVRLDDWIIESDKKIIRGQDMRSLAENPRWEGMVVMKIDEKNDFVLTLADFVKDGAPFLARVLS